MKRIDYIDTAKGYLMLAVILGHVLIVLNPDYSKLYFTSVQAFIYVFHMPAFFVIHGILFDIEKWSKRPLKEFIIKRLQTLIIPYVFFEVIGTFWRAIFYKQPLWTGIYNLITIRCNIGADWFLPAMFLGSLLFMIYVKHPNKIYAVFSTVICFLLPMIVSGHQLLIVAGRALLAYGFIMIGSLLKSLFLSEKIKRLSYIGVSLFITALSAIIGLKWGSNDFYTCSVTNPLIFAIGGNQRYSFDFGNFPDCEYQDSYQLYRKIYSFYNGDTSACNIYDDRSCASINRGIRDFRTFVAGSYIRI